MILAPRPAQGAGTWLSEVSASDLLTWTAETIREVDVSTRSRPCRLAVYVRNASSARSCPSIAVNMLDAVCASPKLVAAVGCAVRDAKSTAAAATATAAANSSQPKIRRIAYLIHNRDASREPNDTSQGSARGERISPCR